MPQLKKYINQSRKSRKNGERNNWFEKAPRNACQNLSNDKYIGFNYNQIFDEELIRAKKFEQKIYSTNEILKSI